MSAANLPAIRARRPAWNKGRIVGQKRPLMPKHVWAIRVRLELANRIRDLALFNLAIDSKLRGCDLVKMRVADVCTAGQVKERTSITQSKTSQPVRFEITEGTRKSLATWLKDPVMVGSEHLWPGRFHERATHLDAAVCPPRPGLGHLDRSRAQLIRHAFDAPNQGRPDLPQDREPPRSPASAWPYKDGQHCPLSRCRARRRARNFRGSRNLSRGAVLRGRP